MDLEELATFLRASVRKSFEMIDDQMGKFS